MMIPLPSAPFRRRQRFDCTMGGVLAALVGIFLLALAPAARAQQWRPSLQAKTFYDMFMLNASVGWAVGAGGTIARTLDGGVSWRYQLSGTTSDLYGVWGSSVNDVWAVGTSGRILHWDGAEWIQHVSSTSETLWDVFGVSASDVWAVGSNGVIRRWDGASWVTQTGGSGTGFGVWGTASNKVWIAGSSSVRHWNGTTMTTVLSGEFYTITGLDASNVWVAGVSGNISKWNGTAWTSQASGTSVALYSLWAADAGNVWAVGSTGVVRKWNGTSWQAQTSGTTITLRAVSGTGTGNVFCAGSGGNILRWNGDFWAPQVELPASGFTHISMVSTTAGYAITDTQNLWKWDGLRWKIVADFLASPSGVWAADANTAYVVTRTYTGSGLYKWDGENMILLKELNGYYDVSGTDANNVWMAGSSVSKWNGSTVVGTGGGGSSEKIHVSDASNIWSAGQSGRIYKWDGSVWTQQTSNSTANFTSIFAINASNAWVVAAGGVVRKWNGTAWNAMNSGTTNWNDVWASDASNVWIVGASGSISKWNGTVWLPQASGLTGTITSISGTSPDNLWAVDSGNIITTAPDTNPLPDISLSHTGGALADGDSALILPVAASGESCVKTFTITNTGSDILSGLAISKSGAQVDDFAVSAPGSTTLQPGTATTFTVTYTAGAISPASVSLQIASNVSGSKSPYDLAFTGRILSTSTDTDSDGMSDAAELKLAALGFDWQVGQTALVSAYYANASTANLYTATQYDASRTAGQNDVLSSPNTYSLFTPSQVQALHIGVPLIQKNAATGEFTVTFGLEKSTNLTSFSPFPVTAPQTTINGQGKVELKFTVPDNAAFFRLQSQ